MSNIGTAGAPDPALKPELRTPLKRVRGLGAAKSGVGHWWRQRVTALVLLLLVPWIVGLLVSMVGNDAAHARDLVARPWNAIALASFVIAGFWHARLGLQVVIEDYVHVRWLEVTLQLIVLLACALATIVSLYALGHVVASSAMLSN